MGQARRNTLSGKTEKKLRFLHLLRLLSKYTEYEIAKFAKNRNFRRNKK